MRSPSTATRAGAQDVATSNSLTDLAARIRAEHEASALHVKRGLDHAIACGRLLLEAKAQLAHGQWLPWLGEHCGVPERSARRYMDIAAYAPSEGISANLADLALDGAAEATPDLASIGQALEAGDWKSAGALAVRCFYDSPFSAQDFERDDWHWLMRKLRHQLKVPCIAAWCFDVAEHTADDRPALRLCPWDELFETAKALAPIAGSSKTKITELKVSVKFDSTSFDSIGEMLAAIVKVELVATWMLGNILNEIKDRDHISDDRYEKEWNETHQHVMARIDRKVADLERERVSCEAEIAS
jgi:hypothetical protein